MAAFSDPNAFRNALAELHRAGWSRDRLRAYVRQIVAERCRYEPAERDAMLTSYDRDIDAVTYARDGLRVYPRRVGRLLRTRA